MARQATATAGTKAGRSPGLLLVAVLAGVLAAALMLAYLNSQEGSETPTVPAAEGGPTVSVVVAKREIPFGTKITADMLEVRELPAAAALAGALTDPQQLIGKVTTAPMVPGEQFVPSKVSDYSGQDTLSYRVPEGRRGVSVQIPHEAWAAAGLVQPGDYVDILALVAVTTTDPATGEEKEYWTARIIAQNVPVLAVAQTLVPIIPQVDRAGNVTGNPEGGYRPVGNKDFHEAVSVTFGLTPEEAAMVAMVDAMPDNAAQFRILVRQTGDQKPAPTTTWDQLEILGGQ